MGACPNSACRLLSSVWAVFAGYYIPNDFCLHSLLVVPVPCSSRFCVAAWCFGCWVAVETPMGCLNSEVAGRLAFCHGGTLWSGWPGHLCGDWLRVLSGIPVGLGARRGFYIFFVFFAMAGFLCHQRFCALFACYAARQLPHVVLYWSLASVSLHRAVCTCSGRGTLPMFQRAAHFHSGCGYTAFGQCRPPALVPLFLACDFCCRCSLDSVMVLHFCIALFPYSIFRIVPLGLDLVSCGS